MEDPQLDQHLYVESHQASGSRSRIAPVSLARRKEANRLAANRSRARQAERLMALEVAAQALAEENLGLKEQIAKVLASRQTAETPRAVLEALMSGPEGWDVEGLFGELALQQSTSLASATAAAVAATATVAEPDRLGDLATAAAGAGPPPVYPGLLAPASLHLHAEVEHTLRQEIAAKRQELDGLLNQPHEPFNVPTSAEDLQETQSAIDVVNAKTAILRTVVVALKADLDALEKEKRAIAEQLMEAAGATERDKVDLVLRSVRAHVIAHLGGAVESVAAPATVAVDPSASAPATPIAPARRTRRPRTIAAAEAIGPSSTGPNTNVDSDAAATGGSATAAASASIEPEPAEDDAFLLSTLANQHEHAQPLDAATFAALLPGPSEHEDGGIDLQHHRDSPPPEITVHDIQPDDFPQPDDVVYNDQQGHDDMGPTMAEAENNVGKRPIPAGNCEICGRSETSVWRKLVHEGIEKRVCNACGLYFQKFSKIRPPSLWGDGKSLKKRRGPEPLPDGTPRVKRGRPAGSTKKTAQARALEFEQSRQAAIAAAAGVDVGMEIEQQLGDVFAQHVQQQQQQQQQHHAEQEDEEPSAGVEIGHELGVEGLGVSEEKEEL